MYNFQIIILIYIIFFSIYDIDIILVVLIFL